MALATPEPTLLAPGLLGAFDGGIFEAPTALRVVGAVDPRPVVATLTPGNLDGPTTLEPKPEAGAGAGALDAAPETEEPPLEVALEATDEAPFAVIVDGDFMLILMFGPLASMSGAVALGSAMVPTEAVALGSFVTRLLSKALLTELLFVFWLE